MKMGFEIFMLVAEELSISKVAKKQFLTPQCVSDHIKRLEKEYGILLFERKPRFRLTAAGEIMQQNLRNIQILEHSMDGSLKDMAQGERGKFTIGISTSRASVILPAVLSRYYHKYPNVNISFSVDDTPVLEKRLLNGEIDMFIGVNTSYFPDISIKPLATDELKLIISSKLLHQYFNKKEILSMDKGVDVRKFTKIPFTLSFKTGKVNHIIEEYLDYCKLHLNVIYNISDSETQILLCSVGLCASLCPQMLLSTAYRHNLTCDEKNKLYVLPILNLNRSLTIDLAYHKNVVYPKYVNDFITILEEETARIANSF